MELKQTVEKLVEKLQEEKKNQRLLADEKEGLKRALAKLFARKGKVNNDTRNCKNCNKEFVEKENFNWSCRIH